MAQCEYNYKGKSRSKSQMRKVYDYGGDFNVADESSYIKVNAGTRLTNKKKFLDKFSIKKIKSHYYYQLTKEQQARVKKYLNNSRGAKVGSANKGFVIEDDFTSGLVIYKLVKGRGYEKYLMWSLALLTLISVFYALYKGS